MLDPTSEHKNNLSYMISYFELLCPVATGIEPLSLVY